MTDQDRVFEHAECDFESHYGKAKLHVFSFGPHEEDNILCISVGSQQDTLLVRVQSACYTAEIFRATDCDCHEQLHSSLKMVYKEGGLLVYMICDGRGAGLLTKIRGLALGDSEGLDTFDAYHRLQVDPDPRDYTRVVSVLKWFEPKRLALLTNNPRKLAGIAELGVPVEHRSLQIEPTDGSRSYLNTKRLKFGHLLDSEMFDM
ncbi:hypothetical protein [Winogradskya humida]|uniref:hypothetical protein n=1 Tax=Winogradskya humida TaxID=113566 RepID=UPI001943CC36|nr:hypothetical protein [Actinoplanes humidus]